MSDISADIRGPAHPAEVTHHRIHVTDVYRGEVDERGAQPITQATDLGDIAMRYHRPLHVTPGTTRRAVLFVGGVGGGFDSPLHGTLYPSLCGELADAGIAGLRVQFRHPGDLEQSVLDVLAGLSFLEAEGVTSAAVVGHSFGGAVVIQAAALATVVRTCVALAAQAHGADAVGALGPRCSLLLAHGLGDEVLTADCSRHLFMAAREPKQLLLKARVRHAMDEWAAELPQILLAWIHRHLPDGGVDSID